MSRKALSTGLVLVALLLAGGQPASGVDIKSKATEVKISGRIQTQFDHTSAEGEVGAEFLMRRVRATIEAKINELVSGKVQPDYGKGKLSLKDAYMKMQLHPQFSVTTGQFKRPFDLFERTTSTSILVVERAGKIRGSSVISLSSLTEGLGYSDRDIGVMANYKGASKRLGVDFAVTNGEGANVQPSKVDGLGETQFTAGITARPELGGAGLALHAGLSALPKAKIPVTAADSAAVEAGDQDVEYKTAFEISGELGNFKEGLHVQAGAVFGDNWMSADPDDPTKSASFIAAQGIASYKFPVGSKIITAIEPLVRVSAADPNTDIDDDGGLLITPGIQAFFTGRNKISANVDIWSPTADGLDSGYSFKVQTWFHF